MEPKTGEEFCYDGHVIHTALKVVNPYWPTIIAQSSAAGVVVDPNKKGKLFSHFEWSGISNGVMELVGKSVIQDVFEE